MAFDADNTRTCRLAMEGKQIFSVSCEDIEKVNDSNEILKIADQMGVDFVGLKEVEDMKTRMILSLKKCEGEPNYKDVVSYPVCL